MSAAFTLRKARAGDEDSIVALLQDFAAYEKLTHIFKLTREIVTRDLLGPNARAQCEVAECDGVVAGLMVWYRTYGTFEGVPYLFLEDIYVRPEFRRRGIARAFFKRLAQQAMEEGSPRVDWIVLNWNKGAIDFYRGLGANLVEEWQLCRVRGEALERLASLGE